jgi:Zn-dependent M28 family amino/carboxypeptidase
VTGAAATWIGQDGKARVVAPEAAAGAFMSAKGGEKLFEGAEKDFAALRKIEAEGGKLPVFELPVRIGLKGGSKFRKVKSANVVALIEGSDGALADEALVVTAHLDHIGKRRPKEKGEDVINNGALDNAIGVAMMIEAARDIADERPRRSVVFVALTGEEKGLLGSDYFARYPTLGDKQIVANVNLDMPLPLSPLKDVIAFGAERTSLGPVVKRTAAEMNVKLTPDPFTEEGIFTRSDHYSFVEQGVPAIFLFTGVEGAARELFDVFMKDRYHQPSDDLTQKIDWKAAADFTELNARIIRALAAGEERPSWNEGDFFGELFAQ